MLSDEENYMSDKFLSECVKQDIRPGLIRNRARQREIEVATKKIRIDKERKKVNKPDEKERLETGLKSALTTENKGFALLTKMGYKQGQALGKSQSGITEPLSINVKLDKSGLGRQAALQELNEKRKEIRRRRLLAKTGGVQISVEEYRKQLAQKAEERFLQNSIRKCQLTCEKLDAAENVKEPVLPWFWPDSMQPTEEDKNENCNTENPEEDIEYELTEQLSMLTNYLRMSYNYCHWCGVHYDDIDDLQQNCPGSEKDDH